MNVIASFVSRLLATSGDIPPQTRPELTASFLNQMDGAERLPFQQAVDQPPAERVIEAQAAPHRLTEHPVEQQQPADPEPQTRRRRRRSFRKHYRINGTDVYTIVFRKMNDGTIKIFCTEHPPNPRCTDVSVCHLYPNGEVCVTAGKEPRRKDRAKAIAMAFCQGYSEYIRTGRFPNGRKRVDV